MNKKIFLTSAVIMCMACPAIAEQFPGDGNMLENKTYDNAATYANTGIYEGDVTADAEYSLNPYSVSAGSYFTGIDNSTNQATTAQCTSGNYCPGVASTTFDNNAFGDTGLRACPANYSGSATGATANTDCYRACSTTDVAKSATVSGQMYYDGTSGDGVNACSAATCVSGWHIKPGITLYDRINSNWGTYAGKYAHTDTSGIYTEDSGSVNAGFLINLSGTPNMWEAYYGDTSRVDGERRGLVVGQGHCSNQNGGITVNDSTSTEDITVETTISNEPGIYCWCNVTGYQQLQNSQMQTLSSKYVYAGHYEQYVNSTCGPNGENPGSCAYLCGMWASTDSAKGEYFRSVLYSAVNETLTPSTCEANTINITWNDASAEDIAATGAATTVYEGDIKTPLKAITKPGKTFVGWKFIKTQQ